jgi:hypothetical protein
MLKLFKKEGFTWHWQVKDVDIKLYPSNRSCVKQDMSNVRPQQMPPLMVRKAMWRR